MPSTETLLLVVIVAVVIHAVAIVAAVATMLRIRRVARAMRNDVVRLLPPARALVTNSRGFLRANGPPLRALVAHSSTAAASARNIAGQLEVVSFDFNQKLTSQLERLSLVSEDMHGRLRETASEVNGVLGPVMAAAQAVGLGAGAVRWLPRRNR